MSKKDVPTTDSEAFSMFTHIVFECSGLTASQQVSLGLILGCYYGQAKGATGSVERSFIQAIEKSTKLFEPKGATK